MSPDSEQKREATPFSPTTSFEGKSPQWDKTVFVDPMARLIGDVVLGPEASV